MDSKRKLYLWKGEELEREKGWSPTPAAPFAVVVRAVASMPCPLKPLSPGIPLHQRHTAAGRRHRLEGRMLIDGSVI